MAKITATGVDYGVPASGLADVSVAPAALPALQNTWTNTASRLAGQYWRDSSGIVHLEGNLTVGTLTAGTLISTLPVGFRPAGRLNVGVTQDTGAAYGAGSLVIDTDGTIKVGAVAFTAAATVSLDGIAYRAAA